MASRYNNLSEIRKILEQLPADLIADVNFKDTNDWTSLHYSSQNGNYECALALI